MPSSRAVHLVALLLCLLAPSIVSGQDTPDLNATHDDNETFIFDYPADWELTNSPDSFGVELTGTVDDVTVTLSLESVPLDLLQPADLGLGDDATFPMLAEVYSLDDYDTVLIDDRNAIFGTVGSDENPITVLILRTTYDTSLDHYVAFFIVTDADNGYEIAEDIILAIASTVIERDAEPVLVAPTGLGGIMSDDDTSATPVNSIRALAGDASEDDDEADDDDEQDDNGDAESGLGNAFGDDDNDDD